MIAEFDVNWRQWGLGFVVSFGKEERGLALCVGPLVITIEGK